MLRNNKGFSLVELFAVIFIASAIIYPLMTALVGNIEINDRLHLRRSATSIADGALYGIDKLDFTDLYNQVGVANSAGEYYVELNIDNCSTLFSTADQNLCDQLFATIWNNLSLDAAHYRVFVYDYNLPQSSIDDLYGNALIPLEVRNDIYNLAASSVVNTSLLRVSVWIQYYDDPIGTIMISGLIFDE